MSECGKFPVKVHFPLDSDTSSRAFTLFWLFPVSLLVGLVSIQNISLFWPSLVSSGFAPSHHSMLSYTTETILRPTPLAIRSHSVFHPDPLGRPPRPAHPTDSSTNRQESAHNHDTICTSRPHYDALLQVPHRQRPGILLRGDCRDAIHTSISPECCKYQTNRNCRHQLPERWTILRWLAYVLLETLAFFWVRY